MNDNLRVLFNEKEIQAEIHDNYNCNYLLSYNTPNTIAVHVRLELEPNSLGMLVV